MIATTVELSPRLVRWIRKGLGLSQAQFAARIGFSQSHVSHVETGYATLTPNFAEAVTWAFADHLTT